MAVTEVEVVGEVLLGLMTVERVVSEEEKAEDEPVVDEIARDVASVPVVDRITVPEPDVDEVATDGDVVKVKDDVEAEDVTEARTPAKVEDAATEPIPEEEVSALEALPTETCTIGVVTTEVTGRPPRFDTNALVIVGTGAKIDEDNSTGASEDKIGIPAIVVELVNSAEDEVLKSAVGDGIEATDVVLGFKLGETEEVLGVVLGLFGNVGLAD